MSNSSTMKRQRARAASASRTHARHAPHQHESAGRGLLVPSTVTVTAPHCDCKVPMILLCCRCCGAMGWECARDPIPKSHVRVKVVAPPRADDFSDLAPPQQPDSPTVTPTPPPPA